MNLELKMRIECYTMAVRITVATVLEIKRLWKWWLLFSYSIKVYVGRRKVVLNCDRLIALVDKNVHSS